MEGKNLKYIYFLGIGGIGMSALARYYKRNGYLVAGFDKTETMLTKALVSEGITIKYNESIEWLKNNIDTIDNTLIVLTPAIPKENTELLYLQENKFTIHKRAQVLGHISSKQPTLAIAGTHGKTTTSTMLAHIVNTYESTIAFMGGIASNYNSNLLLPKEIKSTTPCVVEADEYDRSFLHLKPQIAALTSIDADHLDIYGSHEYMIESYTKFVQLVKKKVIIKKELNFLPETSAIKETYSLTDNTANYYASNIKINNGYFYFNFNSNNIVIENIKIGIPGNHNIENAVAAIAIAINYGITNTTIIKKALENFKGVKRRFEYIVREENNVYIDDYAHHPTELKAIISAVKELYPNHKITGVFQPHLYSRTRDFAAEFSESLSMLHHCILLPIYPARELPIEGITSNMLLNNISSSIKYYCEKNEVEKILQEIKPKILLSLGAGDIDGLIDDFKNFMENEK